MTDVPVIPDASGGPSPGGFAPSPPQQAETPTAFGSSGGSSSAYGRISELRQSVDERLLATSDDRIKMIWKVVNGTIGGLILLNGVLRLFKFGITESAAMFSMSIWLIVFGIVFILIELKLPRIDDMLRKNVDYMYFPGFRAFILTFVGTMMWWWWLGIVVSVICFLGAIFNFYVMKTHPAFGHSSNIQEYEPPANPGVAPGAGFGGMAPGPNDYSEDAYGSSKL